MLWITPAGPSRSEGNSQIHAYIAKTMIKKLQKFVNMRLSCFQPLNLCDIEEVVSVLVSKEDEISQKVDIELRDPEKEVRTRERPFC